MPWGQQRWASLGATANLRCQRGGLGAPSCPHGTFVQQTTGGLAPKQGGAGVAAVGATWEDPGGLLALAPPSGVPGAAPGDAMGVLGLGRGARSPYPKPPVQGQGKLRLVVRLLFIEV